MPIRGGWRLSRGIKGVRLYNISIYSLSMSFFWCSLDQFFPWYKLLGGIGIAGFGPADGCQTGP